MFGLFKNSNSEKDAALLKQALGPNVAVVLSASCCMPGSDNSDTAVADVVQSVIDAEKLDFPVLTVTVTQAQNTLGRISGELDEKQGLLAKNVTELFMSHGLTAFPVLILNQRIVSYGGVPSEDIVRSALKTSKGGDHESAA